MAGASRALTLLAVAVAVSATGCSLIVEGTRVEDSGSRPQEDAVELGASGELGSDLRGPFDGGGGAGDSIGDARRDDARRSDGSTLKCPPGNACSDSDPCTVKDTCNSLGVCTGARARDGTSCGTSDQARCCSGRCVNIAADENNCGGCGLTCAPGFRCQGAAQTSSCSKTPQKTSGRCLCTGAKDSLCPKGQTCRAAKPYPDHCSPKDTNGCAPGQSVVWVTDCPNFCNY